MNALFLVLAVAAAPSTYPPGKEPFPFPPATDPIAEQAFQLLERREAAQALPLVEQLLQQASDNPRSWRLAGFIYMELHREDDADRAFERSLELKIDDRRRPSVLGSRAVLAMSKKRWADAEAHAHAALKLDPREGNALVTAAVVAGRANDLAAAQQYSERLIALAPQSGFAHVLLAQVLVAREDFDGARREAAQARALGESSEMLADVDGALRDHRYRQLAWQVPLGMALFLGLSLLLFFIAGSLLSRAEIGRLSSVRAHLVTSEQTAAEWIIERLYGAVLWGGTLLFYVGLPAMILLTVVSGLGLVYLMFAYLPRIPLQLVAILVVAAVGGAWAILRGLFLDADRPRAPRRLTDADAPRLFTALREVAGVAGARMVDRVHLEPGTDISVREDGGALRVLLGGGERVLTVGFGALRGLSIVELKAILAHEYGHFAHGETRLNPVIGRILGSTISILQRLARLGTSATVNPVYWYLRLYFKVYLGVTAGQGRRRELLADRAAALAYGGETFGRALTRVVDNGVLYDRSAAAWLVVLRQSGRPCDDLYRCLDAAHEATPERLRALRLAEHVDRAAGKYDTHPPPHDRIARVAGIHATRPVESGRAIDLLPDPPRLARELTAEMVERVDAYFSANGVVPAPQALDGDSQARLVAALSLHRDARDLGDLDDPASDALLEIALEELEAVCGPSDPLLVEPLARVARMHLRLGRSAQARAAAERALALGAADDMAADLRQLLEDAPAAA